MALLEDVALGVVAVDRIRPSKAFTVASPPSNAVAGDLAYFSNGSAGNPCWAFYDGSAWKVSSTGATISAT
jgi:hypothetical protein